MKQYKTLLCIALSATLLASCSSDKAEIQEPADTEITSVSTPAVTSTKKVTAKPVTTPATEAVTEPKPTLDPYYPVIPVREKDLPSMDGSTSAIPLEAGIKAMLFGLPYKQVLPKISHSKTHEAFQKLLAGETDLIFSVPISESQQQDADDAGVHLNMVPVAKEAFVFIVNKDNPVSSLTQEQIRDIYSGKITNWAEVGGNDAEIIPYQRNKDSGSQNYMTEFMEGYDFPEPVYKTRIFGEMGALVSGIANYDNAVDAIGYSVFSYAVQMAEHSDGIKLITIDGITPSKETMADGTYPLLSNTYIIHKDNPSPETTRFVNWILSESGQKRVLESGYLPVDDIEYPDYMKLYQAKGTGKKMPENYTPSKKISVISGTNITDFSFIKNEELRKMIEEDFKHKTVSIYGENGYITFFISTKNESKYLTYDLTENKRISSYSDLFFKDSDFVPLLNKSTSHNITHAEYQPRGSDIDFIGITGEISNFSVKGFQFPEKNPYYSDTYWAIFKDSDDYRFPRSVNCNFLPLAMVTGEYHDFNDYVDIDSKKYYDSNIYNNNNNSVKYNILKISEETRHEWYCHSENQKDDKSNYIYYTNVVGSLFHTKEEIEQRNTVINKVFSHLRDKYPIKKDPVNGTPMYHPEYFFCADNIYNVMPELTSESSEYYTETDYYLNLLAGFRDSDGRYNNLFYEYSYFDHHYAGYDQETGEPMTFAEIFGPEFSDIDENYAMFTYSVSSKPNDSDCVRFIYGEPFESDGETEIIEIPIVREHLNMKYFIPADEVILSDNSITNKIIHNY